jgi:hypothetical protein
VAGAASVTITVEVSVTGIGEGRGVVMRGDSTVGEGTPKLQAEVRKKHPIIKIIFFMPLLISQAVGCLFKDHCPVMSWAMK